MENGNLVSLLIACAIVAFMVFVLLCIVGFFLWILATVLKNAELAARYRELQEGQTSPQGVTGPSWILVYKEGRKTETVRIIAETEPEALSIAIKNNVRYDKIISLDREK